MIDYSKLYAILCGAISDALNTLPPLPENAQGIYILQSAILDTENRYIESSDP